MHSVQHTHMWYSIYTCVVFSWHMFSRQSAYRLCSVYTHAVFGLKKYNVQSKQFSDWTYVFFCLHMYCPTFSTMKIFWFNPPNFSVTDGPCRLTTDRYFSFAGCSHGVSLVRLVGSHVGSSRACPLPGGGWEACLAVVDAATGEADWDASAVSCWEHARRCLLHFPACKQWPCSQGIFSSGCQPFSY